jgi:hypothetical protein
MPGQGRADMYMLEDALNGRITLGKSRAGNIPEKVVVELKGKWVYQLQKFLEEEAAKGGNFFQVRWMVVMREELCRAVQDANERARHKVLVAGDTRRTSRSIRRQERSLRGESAAVPTGEHDQK